MSFRVTDPESYITEFTIVHEVKQRLTTDMSRSTKMEKSRASDASATVVEDP